MENGLLVWIFGIIVLTNPKYGFHMIDAGRVLNNMQLGAGDQGIGSGLFTGVKEEKLRDDFAIPMVFNPAVTIRLDTRLGN